MRRIGIAVMMLVWIGCSQQNVPPPAQILGTNGLALFGDLLFVTSTETNEVKVLNVGISPRDFVRAPNPLEPLSIPVLDRPIDLARDLTYDSSGVEVMGPYLYVRGQSSPEISIVGTDFSSQLVELKRVLTSGVVTAVAARAPNPAAGITSSTLFFATADTARCQVAPPDGGQCPPSSVARATLWQAAVPPVDANHRLSGSVTPVPSAEFNSTVTSILVMPNSPNLAIATRTISLDGGVVNGRTVIFNPGTSAVVSELPFPSSVRYLTTNPTVNASLGDGGTTTLDAGARLYGILDESSCPSGVQCPAIVAVDTASAVTDGGIPPGGILSADSTGMPMMPISYDIALPMTITLSRSALIPTPNSNPSAGTFLRLKQSLIGFVPTSNGATYFFDGIGLLPVNGSLLVDGGSVSTPQYFTSDGGLRTYVEGPVLSSVMATNGKARDESVTVVYQGLIPGFQNLTGADGGNIFPAASSPSDGRVIQGDLIVLTLTGTNCPDYSQTDTGLPILSITDAGLVTDGGVPPGCAISTFSVRAAAGPNKPYVVNGSISGYMGRTGPNDNYRFIGTTLYRPCPLNLISGCPFDPNASQISFTFGSGDRAIQRDWFYSMTSFSGFAPEFVQIDSSGAFFGIEFRFPTNVVNVTDLPDGGLLDLFYVSYPSANALIEFDPMNVTPNIASPTGVSRYN